MPIRPTFSVVVPIWNEEQVIPELYKRVVDVMDRQEESWELICVNDGSKDGSLKLLLALREQDPRVKVVDFSRNFGHQVAITAGADFAEGDAVIVMDADLQDPGARASAGRPRPHRGLPSQRQDQLGSHPI